jgi:hypothetical protein
MSGVIVRRRPDGLIQIRRRPAWRAIIGPVPAAILAFLLLSILMLGALAALLVRFPLLVLLVGGLLVLLVSAARYGLQERHPAPQAHVSRPRPPVDAA